MTRRTSKSLNPDPTTFPYDIRAWRASAPPQKILRETRHLTRSRLTDIPETRALLKELCQTFGQSPPQVPLHMRPEKVLWRIGDAAEPIWVEVVPL